MQTCLHSASNESCIFHLINVGDLLRIALTSPFNLYLIFKLDYLQYEILNRGVGVLNSDFGAD